MTCPSCGEAVEARFNLCPNCGHALKPATGPLAPPDLLDSPSSTAGELLSEASGIDRTALATIAGLLREPGEVAAAASRPGPSRFARPLRLYFVVSFLCFGFYGMLARSRPAPAEEARVLPPDELSISFDVRGPRMNVGSAVMAEIVEAGGPDAWLDATGRLEGRSPVMGFIARRGLQLEYDQRFDEATSAFADNRALISLLGIPLLTAVLAIVFFGAAPLAAHLNLAAVLVSGLLVIDVLVRVSGIALFLAGVGGNLTAAMAMLALQLLVTLVWTGVALHGFYGPGRARLLLSTPVIFIGMLLSYVVAGMLLSAVFVVLT